MEPGLKQMLKLLTQPFWPDVREHRGRKLAIVYGAALAVWMCLIYVIIIYELCFIDESTTLAKQLETLMYFGPLMLLAPFLGWRIWRHAGYISAIIMLAWVSVRLLWEMIPLLFISNTQPGNMQGITIETMVYYFAMLFFSMHGVRGTMPGNSKESRAPHNDKSL
ncbi:hypothetical protein MMIC_P1360 [Mariprofundus micogutta]|uniref:Uncharacterized protein n=1 Tax=Mariprofundus micogutta TaxID=1921010 RepID=A0A1L8CNA8_9PROT|nr:hypothetical protein [Mariprofundus micogutta]GAV20395.1 hypothetical protein MMIC_P1360 [Mariprofundus micogutta]